MDTHTQTHTSPSLNQYTQRNPVFSSLHYQHPYLHYRSHIARAMHNPVVVGAGHAMVVRAATVRGAGRHRLLSLRPRRQNMHQTIRKTTTNMLTRVLQATTNTVQCTPSHDSRVPKCVVRNRHRPVHWTVVDSSSSSPQAAVQPPQEPRVGPVGAACQCCGVSGTPAVAAG